MKFFSVMEMQTAALLASVPQHLQAKTSEWKLLTLQWLSSTLSLSWWLESG